MNILLDTHILLWALANDSRLSPKARSFIVNPENMIYYSVASIWEVTVKHLLHPDSMECSGRELAAFCDEAGFECLELACEHVFMLDTLKRPENAPRHKDPFDQMLIAQAKSEDMLLLTHDALLPYYNEACIVSV